MKSERELRLRELILDATPEEIADNGQYYLRRKPEIYIKNTAGYFEVSVSWRLYKYIPKVE